MTRSNQWLPPGSSCSSHGRREFPRDAVHRAVRGDDEGIKHGLSLAHDGMRPRRAPWRAEELERGGSGGLQVVDVRDNQLL